MEIWTRVPVQGCWTASHESARITSVSAMKHINASVLVYLRLKSMLLKPRRRRRASNTRHPRESCQFNAGPFDVWQQTPLMCSRLTRWPRRRRWILSRCRRGQADDGSRHLRLRYWQEAAVSGHKITVTLLLKLRVFSEAAIVPLLLSFWVHQVVKEEPESDTEAKNAASVFKCENYGTSRIKRFDKNGILGPVKVICI